MTRATSGTLTKPFGIDDLISVIDGMLARALPLGTPASARRLLNEMTWPWFSSSTTTPTCSIRMNPSCSSMGHEPITKMTLASGPETVREVGADALLVDLQQPDEDAYGVRIIEELRSDPRTSHVPIILCTGAPKR